MKRTLKNCVVTKRGREGKQYVCSRTFLFMQQVSHFQIDCLHIKIDHTIYYLENLICLITSNIIKKGLLKNKKGD